MHAYFFPWFAPPFIAQNQEAKRQGAQKLRDPAKHAEPCRKFDESRISKHLEKQQLVIAPISAQLGTNLVVAVWFRIISSVVSEVQLTDEKNVRVALVETGTPLVIFTSADPLCNLMVLLPLW